MKKVKGKKYANLISLEKYKDLNEAEKYDFLLKNNIYIKPDKKKQDTEYIGCKNIKQRWVLDTYYIVNPIIINELVCLFLNTPIDISTITDKIKVELSKSLDISKTIKKWHKKYSKIITDSYINPLTFYEGTKTDKDKLKTYITEHFKNPNCNCIHLQIIETYIFDVEFNLYQIDFFNELKKVISCTDILTFLQEQIHENKEEKSKTNSEQLTTRQAVILIEEIQRIENWSDTPATKKAAIISKLIGRNIDNIRKMYSELEKKPSEIIPKFKDDMQIIFKLLKNNKLI